MANASINRGGINRGPINGPPPFYVNGQATLTHDVAFGGNAQAKIFGRGGINSRFINKGQINGELGLYSSASATLTHTHNLPANLELGSDTYLFGAVSMGHTHDLTADLTFWQNYYSTGAAVLTHAHTLEGDLAFWFSTIVYGTAVLTHDNTFEGDFTFYQDYYVDGSTSMPQGYTLTGDAQTVWLSASQMVHESVFQGNLTEGSDIYRFGSITFTQDHAFGGDLMFYDPVDASLSLVGNHTFSGDLTLLPFNDASATLTHDHDLEWTDTQSVLCSSTMIHTSVFTGNAIGGTPKIDLDNLWLAAEPYPDIEASGIDTRKAQYFGINYTVSGYRFTPSELNHCPMNTHLVNGPCGSFPEPDLSGELNMNYGVGETTATLDMQWEYVFDADEAEGQLNMEYDLDISTKELARGELSMGYFIVGTDYYNTVLNLVNEKRAELSLQPYGAYSGAGEDVATTHSNNMAEYNIYAHDDAGLPAGYETVEQRITYMQENPTSASENIAATVTPFPAAGFENSALRDATFYDPELLFDAWWNSPPHKANILRSWGNEDYPEMLLGVGVTYDWPAYEDPDPVIVYTYTQLFVGYGIPAGATLSEGQLNLTYDLDVSLVTSLDLGYSLDAYTRVQSQFEAEYGIYLGVQHELQYGPSIASQHEAPIHYSIVKQHRADWTQAEVVATQHQAGYDMDEYARALKSSSNPYSINVSLHHEVGYSLTGSLQAQHEAGYEPSVQATTQHEEEYDMAINNLVRSSHVSFYALHQAGVQVTTSFATITLKR